MKKLYLFLFLLILAFSLSSCMGGDNTDKTPEPLEPSPVPIGTVDSGEEPLILASIPFENELKLIEAWQLLADYLTEQTGIPVNLDIKNSYKEIIEGLKSGEIDMANTGALVYVKANEEAGAYPLVKPRSIDGGESFYKSYIIVRKDSGIKNISDLKGKTFAFTDRDSTSDYLMPIAMLADAGAENLDFFTKCIFTGDHDSAFLAVYNGYVDGAGISNFAFTKGTDQRLGDILVLEESEPIPTGPIVVSEKMDKEKVEKLKKAFLQIGKDEETKDLLEMIQIKGYTEASDSDYDSMRKVQKALTDMGLSED